MKLVHRILAVHGASMLLLIGVLVLGMGLTEGRRHAQEAVTEARDTGALVAAAVLSQDLLDDPQKLHDLLLQVGRQRDRVLAGKSGDERMLEREITVTDARGAVIASTAVRSPGSLMSGADGPIAQAVRTGTSVMFTAVGAGVRASYCAVPLVGPEGGAGAVVVEHQAQWDDGTLWRLLAGLAAVAVAVGSLLVAAQAGVLGRWFVTPLSRLQVAMEALGWGQFSTRLAGSGSPEIAAVEGAFNDMAERLDTLADRRREIELAAEGFGWGLVLTDPAGVVRWASPGAAALLGRKSEEMKGLSWEVLVPDPRVITEARAPGGVVGRWQDEFVSQAEGITTWLTVESLPLRSDDGRLLGHALQVADVTGARTWTEEQRRLVAALSEGNRFSSGLLTLLRRDLAPRLTSLAGQDWEVRELVQLLVELGDLEEGYLRAVVEECPLKHAVERALESTAVLAATRGVNVHVNAEDIEVLSDPDGLDYCLRRLVGAALYATEGTVRIRVRAHQVPGSRLAAVEIEMLGVRLTETEVKELAAGELGAALLEKGPEAFGLSLYLAAREARVLRAEIVIAEGEGEALIATLLLPLSPLGWMARADGTGEVVAIGAGGRDPLTGLVSRPGFERLLSEEVYRAARVRRGLALLALDVDGLDLLNRRHGRGTGERVLRDVADLTKRALRATDVAARMRGGTFMVLMPDTTRPMAEIAAQKIRWNLNRHVAATPTNKPVGRISVTVGLVGYPENGDTAPALLRAAEAALREAKRRRDERLRAAAGGEDEPAP